MRSANSMAIGDLLCRVQIGPQRPGIRIVGVEPAGAATLGTSLEAGRLIALPELSTIADGLAAKRAGKMTFEHVRELVDDMVTVTEEEIAEGLLLMMERARILVEPAAAVGVAAAMRRRSPLKFPAVVVASGGNIEGVARPPGST